MRIDERKWNRVKGSPVNTLQIFITNACNKRCRGCFYEHKLGKGHIALATYKTLVTAHRPSIDKIILLGGEPMLHPDIVDMVDFNEVQGLRTTIYTNGYRLNSLVGDYPRWPRTTIRVGVLGLERSEKRLLDVKFVLPLDVVYMIRRDNIDELMEAAYYAEANGCKRFMISSIRDISASGSFWEDTKETVPNEEYLEIVGDFLHEYDGEMGIHVAGRGVMGLDSGCDRCRFLNVFPDGRKVMCPFDISVKTDERFPGFNLRKCSKHSQCILQKLVLKRR